MRRDDSNGYSNRNFSNKNNDYNHNTQTNKSYESNHRQKHSQSRDNSRREQGIVLSLKESFGFIKSSERDEDIFFHFSEFEDGNSRPSLRDEVEFLIARQSEKPRAIEIVRLPKGTISLETTICDKCRVSVIEPPARKGSGQSASYGSFSKGRGESGLLEVIETPTNSTGDNYINQTVPFLFENIEGFPSHVARSRGQIICEGDEFICSLVLSKVSKKLQVRNLRIHQLNPKGREQGVVAFLKHKDSFGFIDCVKTLDQLFFHFTSLLQECDENELENRDVEFNVVDTNGQLSASRVTFLPQGSVKFNIVSQEREKGIITFLDQGKENRGEKKNSAGFITLAESKSNRIPFQISEIQRYYKSKSWNGVKIEDGDEVEFSTTTVIATGKKFATNIVFLRSAAQIARDGAQISDSRDVGVVIEYGNSSGYIYSPLQKEKLFFYFSEVDISSLSTPVNSENNNDNIEDLETYQRQEKNKNSIIKAEFEKNGEVEFSVATHTDGHISAVNIKPVPKTSSQKYLIENCEALVIELPSPNGPGKIKITQTGSTEEGSENLEGQVFDFKASDFVDKNICNGSLIIGDTVSCTLTKKSRVYPYHPQNIKLEKLNPDSRSVGIVFSVKPQGYGFIKSQVQNDSIFFHFKNILFTEHSLSVGDEVEFTTQPGNSPTELSAYRVTLLPPGSIGDIIGEEIYKGRVIQVPNRSKQNFKAFGGGKSKDDFGKIRIINNNNSNDISNEDVINNQIDDDAEDDTQETTTTATKNTQQQLKTLLFSAQDVNDVSKSNIGVGDFVEFKIATDRISGRKRCIEVEVIEKKGKDEKPKKYVGSKVVMYEPIRQPKGPSENSKGFLLQRTLF